MKNLSKFTLLLSVLILFSCNEKSDYSKIKNKSTKTITHKIVVKETLEAGAYTYINADEKDTNYWIAIPITAIKVGDTYYYDGGMVMTDFESKELNRKFDEIIFVGGVRSNEKNSNPQANTKITAADTIKIVTAKNGITLEELFKNEDTYAGKNVIVRGVVIKVNNGIMDKNWVHIVDGTRIKKRSSLTITTSEVVKKGDTLTFKGKVTLKKNFGKGYVYPILVEDGQVIK